MKSNEINIRDPFILPYAGKYYMYGTRVGQPVGDGWGVQMGFDVYVSEDLENWSAPKSVFEKQDGFWGEKDFWAPEVHLYNNKFYMLASFKADGKCRATHILVADKPDTVFKPVSEAAATPADRECLDGTLYIDRQGAPHIVFCHEWLQIGNGAVCEQQLKKDLTGAVSAPRTLWHASDCKDAVSAYPDRTAMVTDGPFLFRGENGELFCIWSSFTENGYAELVAKSDNGDIDGDWSVLEQPLSARDGGHGMIFRDFSGNALFVMHKPNTVTLERPCICPLYQENGRLFLAE